MSTASIDLFGHSYPLVAPTEFTLGELCDCEQIFGADFGTEEVNARKLASILYISAKRVDAGLKPSDVRELTAQDLEHVHARLKEWQEADNENPPAVGASESAETPSPASALNGSPATPSESGPRSTGSLVSVTGSRSDPATSGN